MLEKIINFTGGSIAELIYPGLLELNRYLGITTEVVPSSAVYRNDHLKAQDRILDICLQEKTTHYINPVGGMELYDKERFSQESIQLSFIQARKVVYPQLNRQEFMPWLSMLDVLMNNDVDSIRLMLNEYDLI